MCRAAHLVSYIKMILVDMMSDILVLNIASLIHLNDVYINRMSKKGRSHPSTFQSICGRSCCNVFFPPLIWVYLYLHSIFACPVIAASLYTLTTTPFPRCRLHLALCFPRMLHGHWITDDHSAGQVTTFACQAGCLSLRPAMHCVIIGVNPMCVCIVDEVR